MKLPSRSAQRLDHAQRLDLETAALVELSRPRIAREHGEAEPAAAVVARPAFGVGEQAGADAVAVVARRDGEVGDVAVRQAREEIDVGVQVQEADALAVVVLGHEHVGAGRLLAQVAREVAADTFLVLAASSQLRHLEAVDEAVDEAEDERVVIDVGESDVEVGLRIHRGSPWEDYPNWASGIAMSVSAPARIAAPCAWMRGRMRLK